MIVTEEEARKKYTECEDLGFTSLACKAPTCDCNPDQYKYELDRARDFCKLHGLDRVNTQIDRP